MTCRYLLAVWLAFVMLGAGLSGCGEGESGAQCGNGTIESGELCDGANLAGHDCTDHGFAGGTLACTSYCTFDLSGCGAGEGCGNGVIDSGEECDGTDLDGDDCSDHGFDQGVLACASDCTFDTSGCSMADPCGNGIVNLDEDCEGSNLAGKDCTDLGFTEGVLACNDDCTFDTSGCIMGDPCGNGNIDAGEDCDGDNLGGDDCSDHGFLGGELACKDDCSFDTTGCISEYECGDGVQDPGEECDDGAANSDSEPDACRTDCTNAGCGDEVVDTGEDCDDGAANSDSQADACRTDCSDPGCGDEVVDTGEDCDDGAANSDSTPDACRTDCSDPGCGDEVVDSGEECDNGAANSDAEPDACRLDCSRAGCGDEVIDTGEDCDNGAANSDSQADACRTNCLEAGCGDGVVDTGETCDGDAAPCSVDEICLIDCSCGVALPCEAVGDSCDPGATQTAAFVCLRTAGGYACYESCNPEDDPGTCSGSEECLRHDPDDATAGFCAYDECDSYWVNDCASGRCTFTTPDVDRCHDIGSGDDLDTCQGHYDCLADALCINGWCTTIDCAPVSQSQTCADAGDDCQGYTWGDTDPIDLDLGTCRTPCTPWVGTECEADEQCNPDWYVDGQGWCVPARGTAGNGGVCDMLTPATTCAENLICVGDADSTDCTFMCDPDVATGSGDPGDLCGTQEGCVPFSDGEVDLEIGSCYGACDYHGGTDCTDGANWCQPGEIFQIGFDICLEAGTIINEGAICPTPMEQYDFCGPASICLEIGIFPVLRCYDLCMTSEGAFNTTGHPDCRDPSATCMDVFTDVDTFGLCQ